MFCRYDLSFFSTYGGLTQVFPKSNLTEFQEETDTWKAKYFRRALDTEQYIYSVPYSPTMRTDNDTVPQIRVVKSVSMPVTVSGQSMKFKPAVVGAYLDHKTLVEMMEFATDSDEYYGCKDSHKVQCYLLDDGAFLVATNQDNKQIGQFFRDVDIEIMVELYNKTYDRLEQYDFQGSCKIISDNSSNAGISNFRIPSINLLFDLLTVNWWNSIWTWDFFAKRLKYSNLLFVMAYPADCPVCNEGIDVSLIQEPKEDAGPDFCHMTPRYRQNPEKCYDFNKDENDVDCSGPYSRPVSKTLIIVASLITLFMSWFVTPR
ncbi:hypothetical protein KUTeg_020415 [Tegillarca granosa]|uniref:Voltage-dependent calcium channel alpha-2/delta subunit conserved region domain-containing protein n=1 Tax=Tegillarca granosa TaxID=220873 RepID=A0ABQ9E7T8_TEGGR|nr:hypothetical protein KUTeg_020415 [Tegillarca granosa]